MLLLDKTLLKLGKGLWGWIFLITAVRLAALIGITEFASVIGTSLGAMLVPEAVSFSLRASLIRAAQAALLTLAAELLQGELEYRCTARARASLREAIFTKVLELDAGNIERIGPVSAVTSSLTAVEQMQVYYSSYLPSLLFSLGAPVYLFFRLRRTAPLIALILLCVSLILLPVNNVFRAKIEALRKVYWQSVEDMTACYLDSVRGLTTLKLFNREKDRSALLAEKAEKLNVDINRFMRISFTSNLVTEGMIYGSILLSLILICRDVRRSPAGIAPALTILMLSYSYFNSVRQLISATHSALTAVSAASGTEEILDIDTSRPYDPSLPADPEGYEGIRLDRVSFSYGERNAAIEDITMRVPKGKVTALAGLSGCGKSTAAALMMRFFDPAQGHIYIEGKDLLSLKPEEHRKKIIMVPQTVSLYSGTIRDNLRIAKEDAADEELLAVLEEVRLKDWVLSLEGGLSCEVGDAGSRLSGGQRQKIGIARALLCRAEYIIFDEATSSVDRESEEEIWACIGRLAETRTLIIISHRLSTIRDADIIYILENGRITAAGDHAALMEQDGLYARLVREQALLEGGVR